MLSQNPLHSPYRPSSGLIYLIPSSSTHYPTSTVPKLLYLYICANSTAGPQNPYDRDLTKPKTRLFAIIIFVLTVMALGRGMADMTTMTDSSASQTCPASDADIFDEFVEYFSNDPVVVYINYAISKSRDVIVNDLTAPLTDALKRKGTNPYLVALQVVTSFINLAMVGTWANKLIKFLGFGKKKKEVSCLLIQSLQKKPLQCMLSASSLRGYQSARCLPGCIYIVTVSSPNYVTLLC